MIWKKNPKVLVFYVNKPKEKRKGWKWPPRNVQHASRLTQCSKKERKKVHETAATK